MGALHVVYFVDRLESGGAQRQAVELAAHLHQRPDVDVTVLSYAGPDFYERQLREAGVPWVRLPKRGRLDPAFPWRLRRWLRAHRPDVVHAFLLGPVLWAQAVLRTLPARRPVVIAAERNVLAGIPTWESRMKRVLYRLSRCVTANSLEAADQIHHWLGVPREQIAYLPNGIDLARWAGARERPSPIPLEDDRYQLALIGRIAPQKNHLLVLDALAELEPKARPWRVWFVGEATAHPELTDRLRTRIDELGLQEVVRMMRPERDIAPFLARMDGILLPSSREGFPNVVLEAMALGVPAIASRTGETSHMIEDERSGLLLDEATAASLARAMTRLWKLGPEGRAALGARARVIAEARYDIKAVTDEHLALYRRLCAEEAGK